MKAYTVRYKNKIDDFHSWGWVFDLVAVVSII